MSDIPSSTNKIQIEATQSRAPASEALIQGMGASINGALDGITSLSASLSSGLASISASAVTVYTINSAFTHGDGVVWTTPSGQCGLVTVYTSGADSGTVTVLQPGGAPVTGCLIYCGGAQVCFSLILPAGWSVYFTSDSGVGVINFRFSGVMITHVT